MRMGMANYDTIACRRQTRRRQLDDNVATGYSKKTQAVAENRGVSLRGVILGTEVIQRSRGHSEEQRSFRGTEVIQGNLDSTAAGFNSFMHLH